jgi:hypothetical protein
MPDKKGYPRRSDRVSIAIPVAVTGTEITGLDFVENTRTHLLSRHGAALVLSRKLAPMQQVIIRNLGSGGEATARIIGQMGGQADAYIYGVALLDTTLNFWKINFPDLSDSEQALFRLLLECGSCEDRELVYLGELESEVFEANRHITRYCNRCKDATVWQLAPHEITADPGGPPRGPAKVRDAERMTPARSKNDRQHVRVQMKMVACVRQPGFQGEEQVEVENISRGGLSFLSSRTYFQGSNLEVAAPYNHGAANVFVPSRVVRVYKLPDKKTIQYGVAYIRNPRGQAAQSR